MGLPFYSHSCLSLTNAAGGTAEGPIDAPQLTSRALAFSLCKVGGNEESNTHYRQIPGVTEGTFKNPCP